jgi:hypothetical protein
MKTKTLPAGAATLAAAAATIAAALALIAAGGSGTQARAATSTAATPNLGKVVAFHKAMDRLWQDHVTWTRMVIVSFAAGSPDLQPALARLLRNQTDIGNAIKPFYGLATGTKLTSLLRTHIKQAVPVLQAAKADNQAALKQARDDWYANAHQIGAFLSNANPANWPLAATTRMMNEHLKLTTNEAVARLKGNWKADIAAYDNVRAEILMMSDTLADGIIRQFPTRFA